MSKKFIDDTFSKIKAKLTGKLTPEEKRNFKNSFDASKQQELKDFDMAKTMADGYKEHLDKLALAEGINPAAGNLGPVINGDSKKEWQENLKRMEKKMDGMLRANPLIGKQLEYARANNMLDLPVHSLASGSGYSSSAAPASSLASGLSSSSSSSSARPRANASASLVNTVASSLSSSNTLASGSSSNKPAVSSPASDGSQTIGESTGLKKAGGGSGGTPNTSPRVRKST